MFRNKRSFDGSVDRYKARLVANGFHQSPSVDYHDPLSDSNIAGLRLDKCVSPGHGCHEG